MTTVAAAASWDHAMRPLGERERRLSPSGLPRLCQHPRCMREAWWEVTYRFVAAKRTGRVATRRRRMCDTHAQVFADLHHLELGAHA